MTHANWAKPAAVYRHFDTDDVLLYIGCTQDLEDRWRNHRFASAWHVCVARTEVTCYSTRLIATRAEREAIRKERPLFNNTEGRACRYPEGGVAYLDRLGVDHRGPPSAWRTG